MYPAATSSFAKATEDTLTKEEPAAKTQRLLAAAVGRQALPPKPSAFSLLL